MEIRIPEVGESVVEAVVGKWYRKDGETVAKDENICEIETDKVTLEIAAQASGVLTIAVKEGTTVPVGTVIGTIKENGAPTPQEPERKTPAPPVPPLSPAVRKLAEEKGVDLAKITGTGRGGRITLDDLEERRAGHEGKALAGEPADVKPVEGKDIPAPPPPPPGNERTSRKRMSPIRKTIAERLSAWRRETAPLTTFNEVDMTRVLSIRKSRKEDFVRKHGVSLGFMPFFIKAAIIALQELPQMNASIEGEEIVQHFYYDIGIAVSSDRGLVVPVLRDADRLHFWEIEQKIKDFSDRAKDNRLALAELEGGTFTITNGGVFGSLLSTPLINPPQTGVLGMHAVQDRPVAVNGQVEIRPMMYLALTYDHRLVDGREAVLFLKKIKECIENPEEMLPEA